MSENKDTKDQNYKVRVDINNNGDKYTAAPMMDDSILTVEGFVSLVRKSFYVYGLGMAGVEKLVEKWMEGTKKSLIFNRRRTPEAQDLGRGNAGEMVRLKFWRPEVMTEEEVIEYTERHAQFAEQQTSR